jgi:hypothetical protein
MVLQHYDKNHVKLAGFRKQKKYLLKPANLSKIVKRNHYEEGTFLYQWPLMSLAAEQEQRVITGQD